MDPKLAFQYNLILDNPLQTNLLYLKKGWKQTGQFRILTVGLDLAWNGE